METGSLLEEIDRLKTEKNAIVLAHNYQPDEIQAMADFTGDSLQLSRKAAANDADVIVFCGVHFMAETAAILSPEKTVLLPVLDAGCPMADMATGEQVRQMKRQHPDAAVVCYVNSSADVKAESDCCCTSSNAEAVLEAFSDAAEILFVPDQNLGEYAGRRTGCCVLRWEGYCPIHVEITAEDVQAARRSHPDALLMVHPECTKTVRDAADHVLSTGQMCAFASESDHDEFIVGTEVGILFRLRNENPDKSFYPTRDRAICEDMKKISLTDVRDALRDLKHRIQVEPAVAARARQAIERMIALG